MSTVLSPNRGATRAKSIGAGIKIIGTRGRSSHDHYEEADNFRKPKKHYYRDMLASNEPREQQIPLISRPRHFERTKSKPKLRTPSPLL